VEGTKHLSTVPITTIPYENAQEFMTELIDAKHLYGKIRRAIYKTEEKGEAEDVDGTITEDELDNMLGILGVDNFERDWLETIIILDDVGGSGLFNKETSAFNNWLRLSRDINIIWFLCLHGIGQLPPTLRQNTATIYISKNLSNERMAIIHRTTNNCIDWSDFKEAVQQLKQNEKYRWIICDNIEGILSFE
jgi:hypothetical protein